MVFFIPQKDLNGTQNTSTDFDDNWDVASTWVEGVAVNEATPFTTKVICILRNNLFPLSIIPKQI